MTDPIDDVPGPDFGKDPTDDETPRPASSGPAYESYDEQVSQLNPDAIANDLDFGERHDDIIASDGTVDDPFPSI